MAQFFCRPLQSRCQQNHDPWGAVSSAAKHILSPNTVDERIDDFRTWTVGGCWNWTRTVSSCANREDEKGVATVGSPTTNNVQYRRKFAGNSSEIAELLHSRRFS